MAMSSDDVNYLVYRYLLESGFSHTAFSFAHESLVCRTVVADSDVPPGALLSFLQKGLQYVEIESHLQEDGTERPCDEPFHLLAPHICRVRASGGGRRGGADGGGAGGGADGGSSGSEFASSEVTLLAGHSANAYTCAWGPPRGGAGGVLASGSGDGTARLWRLGERTPGGGVPCTVLRHAPEGRKPGAAGPDVSSVDWHPDGSRVATGCNDGRARVWDARDGSLLHTLAGHTGAIFTTAWSPGGAHLLTGGADKTAIVWDAAAGAIGQAFAFHTATVLDAEWGSDSVFATCSSDKTVAVCALGADAPVRLFAGHSDEVNALGWSPARTLLASGSDDGTARLWAVGDVATAGASAAPAPSGSGCAAVLSGHKKSIYGVEWAPTGEGSPNPHLPALLATASYDCTVRLWDPAVGRPKATLARHAAPVYALGWSPDGTLLASGSSDRSVLVWDARDGSVVRSFAGSSGVFDVSWSADGGEVAAACANGTVAVLSLRR